MTSIAEHTQDPTSELAALFRVISVVVKGPVQCVQDKEALLPSRVDPALLLEPPVDTCRGHVTA